MMIRFTAAFIFLLALTSTQAVAAPCLSTEGLAQLEKTEATYMLERIPPAFKHAYNDQRIKLEVIAKEPSDTGGYEAIMNMSLPMDDLNEAHEILDKDPAKQILLFSQGYSLPDQPRLSASFKVNPQTLGIAHQDMLQVNALGKLHASVEMMYALLSQARAVTGTDASNNTPWSPTFTAKMIETCVESLPGQEKAQEACGCRATELSKHYGERTMENILYVESNPFAEATGATAGFSQLQSEVNRQCKPGT
ncbi:MAG TPA: hypothetical protein VIE91_05625 [Methylophilaceae bacterium]|jgi:hypothetical protein